MGCSNELGYALLVRFLLPPPGPRLLKTSQIFSLAFSISRLMALPVALVATAFVRGGRDRLELESRIDAPLSTADGTICARVVVMNPTRSPIAIDRVDMTVSDSLGTFTLRSETPPTIVPAGFSMAIELLASNFKPLRLSRRCVFRARFFNGSGCVCTFAQSFTNVWPAEYFEDAGERISLESIPFLQRQASARTSLDRRHDGGEAART